MDIGTGIAIAGVWVLPVSCALSRSVTSHGFHIGLIVAIVMTVVLK